MPALLAMLVAASGAGLEARAAPAPVRDQSEAAERLIEAAGVRHDQYGLMVRPLGNGTLGASHRSDRPLNPASTMKLITTHASMALLGPDYRWVTSVYTTGPVEGESLNGNLIIKGGGDPKLVVEDVTALIRQLRLAGLREIHGDLIIDDSLFAAGPERLASFDGDDSQPYNVRPYAALMNFKATRFLIDPKRGKVTMDPPLADVRIDNQVKVLQGKCRPNSTGFSIDDAVGTETRPTIRISGTQVRACGEQFFYASALTHRQFIHGFFKAAWKQAGGLLTGTTRVGPGAATGNPYYNWYSPRTLSDVVRDINKFSNNVMARMLLLQMAAHNQQTPATLDDARRIVQQWYANQGLPMTSLVLENGSGLSRIERVSAGDLTAVLAHAAASIHAAAFEDSLPQVGIDGTMRTRLRRSPVAGNAYIKTGTLRDVRAIAGYVTAISGERYAVALLINGPLAEGARKAQDDLLRWIYQNG